MPVWTAAVLAASLAASRVGLVAFQRVNVPEDVPAHLCSAIAQDSRGMLWFGTQGGLVRYDGEEFRVFRSNPADRATLPGNYVRTLLAASDGRLWVGTFSGGLSVFDPRTETFTRFDRGSVPYDRVEGLAEDRSGRIWVATTAGVSRLDPRTGRAELFRHKAGDGNSLADDRSRGLLVDREGTVWVGTRDGLQRWNERDGFHRVAPELAGQYVIRLYEDRQDRIWIGTEENGAAVFDPRTGVLRRIAPRPADPEGLSHYWVYGFAESVPGEMWIATFGGGVDIVDETSLRVIDRLRNDPTLPSTIGADRVGAVFRDRSGMMWVGTWGEGIARHDPRTRAFRALRASPQDPNGLTHRSVVRAMEMRDGTIWAGTNGNGIDILDPSLRRIGGYRADPHDPGALADGAITCLAQSDDGTIWVATLNSMLHRLRPGSTRFDRVPALQLPGGPIRTIAFGRDGALWAGAAEGMARVDPASLATKIFRRWPGAAESSPAIESIVVAADGILWVGTDNGLYHFDPRSESAVRIAKDDSRPDSLPDNWVPDLMIARDGRLWVGTAGGACVLTHFDGRRAQFDRVSDRIGRLPAPAESLVEDAQGSVWIGPRLRVDPRTWTARVLGPADGCAFRNFFIASRSRARNGMLLFGSPEGLLIADPADLPTVPVEAVLLPTELQVEGRIRTGAPTLSSLQLTASERSFTIRFSPLDFAAPQQRMQRHRMEGLESTWTLDRASGRSVTYNRLPPGHYVLRVGVTNRDGSWSPRELLFPIDVAPALYQTTWFRALMILAAAALLYLAYRVRVGQLRRRERLLERLVDERTSELADAYRKIEDASLTDPLTGLRNRRFLEQSIANDLELASRGHGDLVLLLADLDHFKSVNDTYGHTAGDAVLTELAGILADTFRSSDYLVRWGGEEFLVVVRFVDGAGAPDLAEKLRVAVAAHDFVLPDGTILRRTCSIGHAVWPSGDASFDRVIDLADGALYEAKRSGRDRCVDARAFAEAAKEGVYPTNL